MMGANTKIQWADHTANIWWGCTEVQTEDGCLHCYARTFSRRNGHDVWGADRTRKVTKAVWDNLIEWNRDALDDFGRPARVFLGSMMDIFEKSMPTATWQGEPLEGTTRDLRRRYFYEIVPKTPNLLHMMLTKRPSNIAKMVPGHWLVPGGWPDNVMTGTSPTTQATADVLIAQLLKVPGRHFLSCEPLLESVSLYATGHLEDPGLAQVIVGGESGAGARGMDPLWAMRLQDECNWAGVPFFMKQLSSKGNKKYKDFETFPESLQVRQYPETPAHSIR